MDLSLYVFVYEGDLRGQEAESDASGLKSLKENSRSIPLIPGLKFDRRAPEVQRPSFEPQTFLTGNTRLNRQRNQVNFRAA